MSENGQAQQRACSHRLNFDMILAQYREAKGIQPGSGTPRRVRFSAECESCRTLITLDTVLTMMISRIVVLERVLDKVMEQSEIDPNLVLADIQKEDSDGESAG